MKLCNKLKVVVMESYILIKIFVLMFTFELYLILVDVLKMVKYSI